MWRKRPYLAHHNWLKVQASWSKRPRIAPVRISVVAYTSITGHSLGNAKNQIDFSNNSTAMQIARIVFLLCFLMSCSLGFCPKVPAQQTAVSTIVCPPLVNPVTIDGKFTASNEWNDSVEVKMTTLPKQGQYPAEAYFSVKCDGTFAYFLWDFPTDKNLTFNTKSGYGDMAYILVDPAHDKSVVRQTDDFLVQLQWTRAGNLSISKSVWGGTNWHSSYAGGITGASSLSTSPHSSIPHASYELAVLRDYFLGSETVGLAAFVYESEISPYAEELWPAPRFYYDAPKTWGDLTFPKLNETTQASTSSSSESAQTAVSSTSVSQTTSSQVSQTTSSQVSRTTPSPFQGIPAFPIEAIALGLLLGTAILAIARRHRESTQRK